MFVAFQTRRDFGARVLLLPAVGMIGEMFFSFNFSRTTGKHMLAPFLKPVRSPFAIPAKHWAARVTNITFASLPKNKKFINNHKS